MPAATALKASHPQGAGLANLAVSRQEPAAIGTPWIGAAARLPVTTGKVLTEW